MFYMRFEYETDKRAGIEIHGGDITPVDLYRITSQITVALKECFEKHPDISENLAKSCVLSAVTDALKIEGVGVT